MKHISLPKLCSPAILAVSLLLVRTSRAQANITNPVTGIWGDRQLATNPGDMFVNFFVYLWNVIMIVGGLIVLFFFVQAAIEWISAGGDSGKIQKARDRMIQSVIGLFILIFSFVIINFISAVLFGGEFNLLKFQLPSADSAGS